MTIHIPGVFPARSTAPCGPSCNNPEKLRPFLRLSALFAMFLLVGLSLAPGSVIAASAPLKLPDLVVSAQWLKQHRDDPDLLILDARTAKAYQQSHISNAVSLPASRTYGTAPRAHLLIPIDVAQQRFRAAGIDDNKRIVVYDSGVAINAARVFWGLQVYGLKHVAVLDGGMPAWLAENGPLSNHPRIPWATDFVPQVSPRELTTKLRVRMDLHRPGKVLIDVRSKPEYDGKESKSRRFGHIPGAISVPWTKNFTKVNGVQKLRPVSELEKLYAPLIPKGAHTTTYCNLGQHAALTYLVLRRLGKAVSAYDGSWHEWGNDDLLPIVDPSIPPKPAPSKATAPKPTRTAP